jgi:hypothetical protein
MATFQSDSYPRTRQIRSTKVGGSNPLQMRSGEDFGAKKPRFKWLGAVNAG